METVLAVVLCVCVVTVWCISLLVRRKKNGGLSPALILNNAGLTFICLELILKAFELISRPVTIVLAIIGILLEIASLIVLNKTGRF